MLLAAPLVVVAVVVGGGCAACIRFGALFSRQRSFFLYAIYVSPVSGLSAAASHRVFRERTV